MNIKALIPIAQGSEELETVSILNLLRRAGFRVTLAGTTDIITCARNTKIIPDKLIENLSQEEEWDVVIVPGGTKGVNEISENDILTDIIKSHFEKNRLLGLICAAPLLLKYFKLADEKTQITSHPSVYADLKNYKYSEEKVVIDNNLITSRGVGTALDFTLKIIELMDSKEKSEKIAKEIVYNY